MKWFKRKQKTNIQLLVDSVAKRAKLLEKTKKEMKYFDMQYVLIDDIIKTKDVKEFNINIGKDIVTQSYIEKPKKFNRTFLIKLKQIIDVIFNRGYVVYYFEDIQKAHHKKVAGYLEYKKG